MNLLAVETSCDETGAAVVREGRVLSNVVASQIQLHAEYGGVVPELATREHLRNWMPVTQAALRAANVRPAELSAIAATQGPGLPNALMVGFKAAQGLAFALGKPFIGIHHHEAHLGFLRIVLCKPQSDYFDLLPQRATLGVRSGRCGRGFLHLDGAAADLQDFRDLLIREVFKVAEAEHRRLARGEPPDRVAQPAGQLVADGGLLRPVVAAGQAEAVERVGRPQPFDVERILGVAADRGDRVAGAAAAPRLACEPLMPPG